LIIIIIALSIIAIVNSSCVDPCLQTWILYHLSWVWGNCSHMVRLVEL